MNLASIRIITANIDGLIRFYEHISARPMVKYTPDFAELHTPTATLAIGSVKTMQFFGGPPIAEDVTQAYRSRSAIIEFWVEDVDQDYERLADFLQPFLVQKPTLMPWGNKSLLFYDPDGNLVNLFTPVSEQAIKKFSGQK